MYTVCFSSLLLSLILLDVTPKIFVDLTLTFTFCGTIISTPANIALIFIILSSLILHSEISNLIFPNVESKFAFLNSSPTSFTLF